MAIYKRLVVPTGVGDYTVDWDGYCYAVNNPEGTRLQKYSAKLGGALNIVLNDIMTQDGSVKEDLPLTSIKDLADEIDRKISDIKNFRLEEVEAELMSHPNKGFKAKKISVAKEEEQPLEEEDEDDI